MTKVASSAAARTPIALMVPREGRGF